MIRKISIAAIILCAFSIQIIQARAATVSFDPGSQTVGLGDPVTVDLRISDLGGDILTGFDLDISFDSSILGFQNFIFGTGLGPGSDQTVDDSVAGLVNVFELSFESDSDLMSSQANDFILGTFNFDTLSLGTSALDISFALLAGEFDETSGVVTELGADLQSGSVSVVPVPAAIWLFGAGLVGLVGFNRRRKAA